MKNAARILKIAARVSVKLPLLAAVALAACQAQYKTNEPQNPAAPSQTQAPAPAPQVPFVPSSKYSAPAPLSTRDPRFPDLNTKTQQQELAVRTQPMPHRGHQEPAVKTSVPPKHSETPVTVSQAGSCVCQEQVQTGHGLKTGKIDILFVVDTSQSGIKEREDVANGIDEFIAELPKEIDYRVALLPAHGSTSALSGRFFAPAGEPKVLSSSPLPGFAAMSQSSIRTALRDRFLNVPPDGRESDRGELGLYSLNRSLFYPFSKENVEAGFFRKDAALAVIFFADENDICAEYPPGIKPKPDPQHMEAVAKARDCKGITVARIYERLLQVKKDMPLSVNGILYTEESHIKNSDRSDAYSDENEIGYGYLDLIRFSNGLEIPLDKGSIAAGLARIGQKMNLKLFTELEFPMKSKDYSGEEINVYIDGVKQPKQTHYYHKETRRVHMHSAGGAGSKIKIEYCRPN